MFRTLRWTPICFTSWHSASLQSKRTCPIECEQNTCGGCQWCKKVCEMSLSDKKELYPPPLTTLRSLFSRYGVHKVSSWPLVWILTRIRWHSTRVSVAVGVMSLLGEGQESSLRVNLNIWANVQLCLTRGGDVLMEKRPPSLEHLRSICSDRFVTSWLVDQRAAVLSARTMWLTQPYA